MSSRRRKRDKKPKHQLRTDPQGTRGFDYGRVNEAINRLRGRSWIVQDAWIRFSENHMLVRDGDYYRVINELGERYRGARTPSAAVRAYDKRIRAPRERPRAGELWVRKTNSNYGVRILTEHYAGLVVQVTFYDTARRSWQDVYDKGKPRKMLASAETLVKRYRREFDERRTST